MVKKGQKIDNLEVRDEQLMNEEPGTSKEKNAAPEDEETVSQENTAEATEATEAPGDTGVSMNDGEESVAGDQEQQDEEVTEKSREQELEDQVAALQDKYLRLTAEYDNYRKRTLREKMELQEGVREEVFVNILPVVDDLERAMESVSQAKDINAVKTGMELIHTKFTRYLAQQGVKEVEAIGLELNTDQHEAITKIPVDSKKKKGKIVDVVEKGYMLRDRVIRFAKVIIGE